MAYTAIDDPEAYFQTVLYTGDGAANNAITLPGDTDMQPDFVWIKNRDATDSHCLFDSVRTATEVLHADTTATETTDADTLTSFDSDGFALGADVKVNTDTEAYVAWNWKANGAGSSNTDGSITSTVSANTTAGFSIVSYTGTSANATVGHGLGSTADVLMVKSRDGAHNWQILHKGLATNSGTKNLELNSTVAVLTDSSTWNDTAPTSSVFTVGATNPTNQSGQNLIAYCFAEKTGYSKFGSYEGNSNADGPFIYTGFRPAFVMGKSSAIEDWYLFDTTRDDRNVMFRLLYPNANYAEYTGATRMDFLSNGFKQYNTDNKFNASGSTYIYMAFAEAPFVNSNGVPCNAR